VRTSTVVTAACFAMAIAMGVLHASADERAPSRRALVLSAPLTPVVTPEAEAKGAPASAAPLGPARFDEARARYVASRGANEVELTFEPSLQRALEKELRRHHVQRGGTVLLQARTGRVLAMASHSESALQLDASARVAFAPAASIAKLPAVAALLRAGVPPSERVCYRGGKRRLQPGHLDDDPRRDHKCTTLSEIIPFSINSALAKLVDKRLPEGALAQEMERWGFNVALPFERPVEVSLAHVPADRFGRANASAGFGDVRLSPLHGALVASVVANDGLLVPPRLVTSGPAEGEARRVLSPDVARAMKQMMKRTVAEGTGVRAFSLAGRSLAGVKVAGKTGSLTDYDGGADYTWFVGFAPVDSPEVVVAAAVENDIMLWHTRAPDVAREALEAYFRSRPPAQKR
jgi:cell division protein FtsI/penicillin-binding protein 2